MTYKNSLLIVILITLIFITNSCSKQDTIPVKDDTSFKIQDIGVLHNEGLNFVYKEIITLKKEKPTISSLEIKNILSQLVLDFGKTKNLNTTYLENYKAQSNISISYEMSSGSNLKLNARLADMLTKEQENFINEVFLITNTFDGTNASNVISRLKDLEPKISSFSDEEKVPLVAGLQTGISSTQYWADHADEWRLLLQSTKGSKMDSSKGLFSWASVLKADIEGAISGAVGTVITGGGVVLGALGGAVGGSAASAISQLL